MAASLIICPCRSLQYLIVSPNTTAATSGRATSAAVTSPAEPEPSGKAKPLLLNTCSNGLQENTRMPDDEAATKWVASLLNATCTRGSVAAEEDAIVSLITPIRFRRGPTIQQRRHDIEPSFLDPPAPSFQVPKGFRSSPAMASSGGISDQLFVAVKLESPRLAKLHLAPHLLGSHPVAGSWDPCNAVSSGSPRARALCLRSRI
ncbi:hypothetical protein PR202_gb19529 [Eleusine coracana subsp. coracana]|uniref:Uncharacterized protein n=1 Tax=Eleusine coracana subsp. coracana TaxID=191504 RepID=A0AAV5F9W9_ELECO|nr:hypothetical protein PR202_gb19529 [Eleusine coracana subsp. coracana]